MTSVQESADNTIVFAIPQLEGFLQNSIAAWMALTGGVNGDEIDATLATLMLEMAYKELLEAHLEVMLLDEALPHAEIEDFRQAMRAIVRNDVAAIGTSKPSIILKP